MSTVLSWWRKLPAWARWALVLIPVLAIVARMLFSSRRSEDQIRAVVKAEVAVEDAEEFVGELDTEIETQPARDAELDSASVEKAREAAEVAPGGAKEVRPGVVGGSLPGGEYDEELGL